MPLCDEFGDTRYKAVFPAKQKDKAVTYPREDASSRQSLQGSSRKMLQMISYNGFKGLSQIWESPFFRFFSIKYIYTDCQDQRFMFLSVPIPCVQPDAAVIKHFPLTIDFFPSGSHLTVIVKPVPKRFPLICRQFVFSFFVFKPSGYHSS